MADTITLTNGRTIEADRAWYEGDQLRYEKNGGIFGIPRGLVQSLSKGYAPEADADPDLDLARERIAAGRSGGGHPPAAAEPRPRPAARFPRCTRWSRPT